MSNSGQTVRRLAQEYGSWFLRDDYLERGALATGSISAFGRVFDAARAGFSLGRTL